MMAIKAPRMGETGCWTESSSSRVGPSRGELEPSVVGGEVALDLDKSGVSSPSYCSSAPVAVAAIVELSLGVVHPVLLPGLGWSPGLAVVVEAIFLQGAQPLKTQQNFPSMCKLRDFVGQADSKSDASIGV